MNNSQSNDKKRKYPNIKKFSLEDEINYKRCRVMLSDLSLSKTKYKVNSNVTVNKTKENNKVENPVEQKQLTVYDNTQPIFPELSDCHRSLKIIINQLICNAHNSELFCSVIEQQWIKTIGDLARLPEMVIHNLPLDVHKTKSVLKEYYVNNYVVRGQNNESQQQKQLIARHTQTEKKTFEHIAVQTEDFNETAITEKKNRKSENKSPDNICQLFARSKSPRVTINVILDELRQIFNANPDLNASLFFKAIFSDSILSASIKSDSWKYYLNKLQRHRDVRISGIINHLCSNSYGASSVINAVLESINIQQMYAHRYICEQLNFDIVCDFVLQNSNSKKIFISFAPEVAYNTLRDLCTLPKYRETKWSEYVSKIYEEKVPLADALRSLLKRYSLQQIQYKLKQITETGN